MKFGLRSIGSLLGALAVVATTALGVSAPAAAAPVNAMVDCTGNTPHQDRTTATRYVADGQAARSGVFAECSVRFWGPTLADLHCWVLNTRGAVWWFVQTPRGQGWVFQDNFASRPPLSGATQCTT